MTTSANAIKFILTPLAISATVFTALTLPLNLFGSKPVTVQIQEEPIFFGELKEFAPQYLGIAGLLSAGVGLTSVALLGWQQSSRKSVEVEQQLAHLAQTLEEKQKLLDNIRSSQSQLDASGLNNWLKQQAVQATTRDSSQESHENFTSTLAGQQTQMLEESLQMALEQQVLSQGDSVLADGMETQPAVSDKILSETPITSTQIESMQALVTSIASVQSAFSNPPIENSQSSSPTTPEVEKIDHQLEQMLAQIISMRQALKSNSPTANGTVEERHDHHPGLKLVS